MNRSIYFNLCEDRLSTLCTRVELRGKLNILDFHLHSEDFYVSLLNLLYGYSLKNVNQSVHNVEGIDLLDVLGKIVLQVSSTSTKTKIESALTKDLSSYKGHAFKFVSISKDASALRTLTYKNPHSLVFVPASDIFDVKSILNDVLHLDIVRQREVYDFLCKELAQDSGKTLTETNLAGIINILAKEDLSTTLAVVEPIPFDVEKKLVFNRLELATALVEDYSVHHARVGRIYSDFDAAGKNKSKSVLDSLRSSYLKLSAKFSGDELFLEVIEHAVKAVQSSVNYEPIPLDELELCVSVLAVDAFIRCRIFKRPKDIPNVAT